MLLPRASAIVLIDQLTVFLFIVCLSFGKLLPNFAFCLFSSSNSRLCLRFWPLANIILTTFRWVHEELLPASCFVGAPGHVHMGGLKLKLRQPLLTELQVSFAVCPP